MAGLFGMFQKKSYEICAPVTGTCVSLSEVPDPTFADGILGKGVAIVPTDGKICAPVDGIVTSIFPTRHAFSMETSNGVEILVHIGLETVSLNGEPFTAHVQDGAKVKKGALIITADFDKIRAAGCEVITPVVVCNADDYRDVIPSASGAVQMGDVVATVQP